MLPIVRGMSFQLEPELRATICPSSDCRPFLGEWLVKWARWELAQELLRSPDRMAVLWECFDEMNRP